jgi:hypothetical protein
MNYVILLLFSLVMASSTLADTFSDSFNSQSYSRNDGDQNWLTDWTETGDDGLPNSPSSSSDVGIDLIFFGLFGGELFLKDSDNYIERRADLSGYTNAILNFDYQESGFDNNGDRVDVYVSDGGSWQRIARYRGSNINSGSASLDISGYISNNTGIQFRTGGGLGDNDYFYVDNLTITASPDRVLEHIAITHDGTAVSCVAENITFTFHDASHGVLTTYTNAITVSARDTISGLTSGSWTPIGVADPSKFTDNGDGTFTYDVQLADNGSFTVAYIQTSESTINFDAVSGALTDTVEDPDLAVADTFSNEGNFRDEFTEIGGTFSDDFETVSYSNSTGTMTWATDWIESERVGGGSAASGDVRITGGRLELTGNSTSGGSFVKSAIEREANLSGAASASLRFTMRTTSVESNDIASVAISSDGGANWTTLGTYNDDISSWRPFSFDISAYISSNTRVRFRIEDQSGSSCCFGPADEILQVEDIQIITDPSSTYGNNDGTLLFATDWIESDGTGPNDGEVSTYLGALYMYGDSRSVTTFSRTMDLSPYDDAVLTFDYEAIGSVDADDQVEVEVNDGSGWTNVETITGNVSGQSSINLKDYLSANTQIRFVIDDPGNGGNCCYNTNDEVFKIDNVDVTVYSVSSCIGVDHFSISHGGVGVNCEPEPVTITAKDSVGNTVVDYVGTITIDTSTSNGDWTLQTGSGSFTSIGSDTGQAEYAFSASDSGTVILNLSDTHVESLSVDVDDAQGVSETSNAATASDDPVLSFARAAFKFIYGTGSPPASEIIPVQTSGRPMAQSLGYDPLKIRAITTDLDTAECTALFTGSTAVDLALECITPSNCSNVSGSEFVASSTVIPENSSGSVTSYQSVNIVFDAAGTGTLTDLNYGDAGRINLRARYQQAGEDVLGSSQNIDVVPAGFCIQTTDGNSDCNGPNYETCSVFKKAGELFNLTVTAQGWLSDGDGDFCDNNFLTPSFESDLDLSPQLIAPSGGNLGAINLSKVNLTGGAYSGNLSWNEVGVLALQAGGNNYLSSVLPTSTSANFGRITPFEFYITAQDNGTYMDGQTDFTYIGQTDLSGNGVIQYGSQPWIDFISRDANGNTILNYLTGGFFKNPDGAYSVSTATLGEDGSTPLAITASFDTPTYAYNAATYTYRLTLSANDHYLFDRDNNALVAPFTNDIQIALDSFVDDDGIAASNLVTLSPAGGEIRYGRMNINNAFGPETEALNQTWQAQYYNGTDFVLNVLDVDTTIDSSNLVGGSIVITDTGNGANPLQAGDSTLSGSQTLVQGLGELTWSVPVSNRYGSFDFEYDAPDWLEYDWSGSGNEDPTASVSFGRYRGHDKVIYWKEITY